ncbi:MAG: hypothetical protein PQJ46_05770 [Spirochaetales bacterium]|nr:hypothetical protein [Spirochaetales bacterium]
MCWVESGDRLNPFLAEPTCVCSAPEWLIQLTRDNIDSEHICCAISDKKCVKDYHKSAV